MCFQKHFWNSYLEKKNLMDSHILFTFKFVQSQHHVTLHQTLISTTPLTYFNFSSTKNENGHRKTFKYTTISKAHIS